MHRLSCIHYEQTVICHVMGCHVSSDTASCTSRLPRCSMFGDHYRLIIGRAMPRRPPAHRHGARAHEHSLLQAYWFWIPGRAMYLEMLFIRVSPTLVRSRSWRFRDSAPPTAFGFRATRREFGTRQRGTLWANSQQQHINSMLLRQLRQWQQQRQIGCTLRANNQQQRHEERGRGSGA